MSDEKPRVITETMARFIKENKVSKVVSGVRLGNDKREARTAKSLSEPGYVRYGLQNGNYHTLSAEDTGSAPDFKPIWLIE